MRKTLTSVPPERWATRQVVIFDWHDGPRDGLCELSSPPCTFHFEILAEQWKNGTYVDRLFTLRELPMGAVDRAVEILAAAGPVTTPSWAPHGPYASDEEQRRVEDAIEALLADGVATRLVIRSRDLLHFEELWLDTRVSPAGG